MKTIHNPTTQITVNTCKISFPIQCGQCYHPIYVVFLCILQVNHSLRLILGQSQNIFLFLQYIGFKQPVIDFLHGLQPTRFLCPWNSQGKNTGVGCHPLLQGIFPTQGSNLGLSHCRQILYFLSYRGNLFFLLTSYLYVWVQFK